MPARKKDTTKDVVPPWFDRVSRIVLALFFALAAGFYFKSAFLYMRRPDIEPSRLMWTVDMLSILAIGFFMFFVAYFYAVRLRAVTRFSSWVPMVTAVAGAFLAWGLVFLPQRMDLSIGVKIAAAVLIFAGNSFALWGLRYLGRSFSILPEGRKLVTNGPYRFIRHPLYLGEAISGFGAMIHFLSPVAVALVTIQLLFQLRRMYYEEKVLRATFPEYAAYAKRTARLIPGIY